MTSKQLAVGLWKAGPLVILGTACYFGSMFLDNAWRYAGDLLWLAPEGLDAHSFAVRLYTLSAQIMRAVYVVIIACLLTWALRWFVDNGWTFTGLLAGALVFWVTAIAETWSVFDYMLCKVVADQYTIDALSKLWAVEGQTSACERFGGSLMAWSQPTVTTLVLAWLLWRALQVWRATIHKPTGG